MARIAMPERLPLVLSPEEVAVCGRVPNLKERAALSVDCGFYKLMFQQQGL